MWAPCSFAHLGAVGVCCTVSCKVKVRESSRLSLVAVACAVAEHMSRSVRVLLPGSRAGARIVQQQHCPVQLVKAEPRRPCLPCWCAKRHGCACCTGWLLSSQELQPYTSVFRPCKCADSSTGACHFFLATTPCVSSCCMARCGCVLFWVASAGHFGVGLCTWGFKTVAQVFCASR